MTAFFRLELKKEQTNQNNKKREKKVPAFSGCLCASRTSRINAQQGWRSAALSCFRETRKKEWKQSVGGELNFTKMELWASHWNDLHLWSLEETHRIQHCCPSTFSGKLRAGAWPWCWWELKLPQGRKSICCRTRTWAHSWHHLTHGVT